MGKFKDLTNEEIGDIVDWYSRGLYSQRELAEIFEVSRATIRRAIHNGPYTNPTGPVEEYDYEVGQPTNQEFGYYDDGFWPTHDELGHEKGPLAKLGTWAEIVAALAALALAGWAGYLLYSVYN